MLDVLKLAARLGFFVVSEPTLPSPCDRVGRVLRFNPKADEVALRAEVVRILTDAFGPSGAFHTLTY